VLVNNAGIASWAHFADSNEEILRQIMEVNFFAPAELIRKAIPILTSGVQPRWSMSRRCAAAAPCRPGASIRRASTPCAA
jgi:NAD(P)-dependent dehydrogenase (short-subunit alcohol dehydrogenase family)